VPTERGGLDAYGWAPTSREPVADISEAVTFARAGNGRIRRMLRLDAGLADRLALTGEARDLVVEATRQLRHSDDPEALPADHAPRIIDALNGALAGGVADGGAAAPSPAWLDPQRVTEMLATRPRIVAVLGPKQQEVVADGSGPPVLAYLLVSDQPLGERPRSSGQADAERADAERDDEDPAASSMAARPVTLAQHLAAARLRAGEIAGALGLPPELVATVKDAAGWHDLGKVEERFQVMLHGGHAHEAAVAVEPLAKSGMNPADRLAWKRAREDSGLPRGARHEAWSAALMEAYLAEREDPYPGDADLLVHLIASHHGHARPLLPLVVDEQPRPVEAIVDGLKVAVSSAQTVSLRHPARFAALNARYGRWGLALLEAIVRCADMTVSAEGS
jgi:CRISPR-associated endonuclease/helicase Cas3